MEHELKTLTARLLAQRWLPRGDKLVRRALVDETFRLELDRRLADVGLRLLDNPYAAHVGVALQPELAEPVFGAGRVAHSPGLLRSGPPFVLAREPRDDAAHERLVVADREPAVDVHDPVVPGRDLSVRRVLARIPIRRDVGVLRAEDHQRLVAVLRLAPQRVRARHVGEESPADARRRLGQERQVVGVETARPAKDERAQRVLGDEPEELVGPALLEVRGQVHACSPGRAGGRRSPVARDRRV